MARIQKQIGIAISDEMRARLEKAAEDAGHSVSEEIRRRLVAYEEHMKVIIEKQERAELARLKAKYE